MNFKEMYKEKMKKIDEGEWIKVFGIELKIKSLADKEYIKAIQKKAEELKVNEFDKIPVELICELVIENILVDWKGMIKDDKEVEFNKEIAKEILLEKTENGDLFFEKLINVIIYKAKDLADKILEEFNETKKK